MRYFFPDSQDFVDPNFDFVSETKSALRVRQRDDVYAHQIFSAKPYDGLLVSKAIVEGMPNSANRTRYSDGQRYRLFRERAHRFFRLDSRFKVMGDSGAFAYAKQSIPPYSVEELINFYVKTDVDYGISLDHIVFSYQGGDELNNEVDDKQGDWEKRVNLTLDNAEKFLKYRRDYQFQPYGVAQGWDMPSYANSVIALKKMGYKCITIGGIITLDSKQVCQLLKYINMQTSKKVEYHLLGIGRLECVRQFRDLNVASIDCTTPLKKAFLNSDKNYELMGVNYCAIKIPQSFSNISVRNKITSGVLSQAEVKFKEVRALDAMRKYSERRLSIEKTLEFILEYEDPFSERRSLIRNKYERTLSIRPWEKCQCEICQSIGVEVIIYRGAERNKRRGFHNIYNFYKEFKKILG